MFVVVRGGLLSFVGGCLLFVVAYSMLTVFRPCSWFVVCCCLFQFVSVRCCFLLFVVFGWCSLSLSLCCLLMCVAVCCDSL